MPFKPLRQDFPDWRHAFDKGGLDKGLFGSQSDLLFVRRDQVINVCELKYSSSDYVFSKKDDEAMRNRIGDIQTATRTRYAIHPTLVTTYGLRKSQYWGTVQSVVTADDLFSPMLMSTEFCATNRLISLSLSSLSLPALVLEPVPPSLNHSLALVP